MLPYKAKLPIHDAVLDTGSVNGEHFAIMAGAGFDARLIAGADGKLKRRAGRAAYLYAGLRSLAARPVQAAVTVDGEPFFTGRLSCVLAANVGRILGGIPAFPDARPDDGRLDLAVVSARNAAQWARTLTRMTLGQAGRSPFAELTTGRRAEVQLEEPLPIELDGGARPPVKYLSLEVHPGALTVCVPGPAAGPPG